MDLARLTNGLALVKQGLDDLDTRIREELSICGQLRRKTAEQRQHTQQLQGQVEEARQQLFEQQNEHDDLNTLLECIKEQTKRSEGRKSDLQDSIKQLQAQVLALVDNFEEQSDDFCAKFHKCKLAEQQQSIGRSQQTAATQVSALMQQLHAKRQQIVQQQSTVNDLRQKIVDSKASIQNVRFQIASESNISSELMLELEQAQHSGLAAQQLAKLKQELSQREEELINQQCSTTVQDIELSRAEADAKQRQQEVARKKAELATLNKTITALGLPPVGQLAGPPQQTTTNAACCPAGQTTVADPTSAAATAAAVGSTGSAAPRSTAARDSQPTAADWAAGNFPSLPPHHTPACSSALRTGPAATVHPAAGATAQQQPANPWQMPSGLAPGHPQQQAQPTHQQPPTKPPPPQQQQYYVEEPDELEPQYKQQAGFNPQCTPQSTPSNDIRVEEVAAGAPAGIAAGAPDNMQLAVVNSTMNQQREAAAAAAGGKKRPRARMVVHETVVTQTLHQGRGGEPGGVVRKRVVVQEVEESVPSRSGGRLLPSKRAVMIKETQQRFRGAAHRHHESPQQHISYEQQQYMRPAATTTTAAAAAAEYEPDDYLDADIAGPAPADISIPDSSGGLAYDAGISSERVCGGVSGACWSRDRQHAGYMAPPGAPAAPIQPGNNAGVVPCVGGGAGVVGMQQWQKQAYNSLAGQQHFNPPEQHHPANSAHGLSNSRQGAYAPFAGVSAHNPQQKQQQVPFTAGQYAAQQQHVMRQMQQRQPQPPRQQQYQGHPCQQQPGRAPVPQFQPQHPVSAPAAPQYRPAAAPGYAAAAAHYCQQTVGGNLVGPKPAPSYDRHQDNIRGQQQPPQQQRKSRPEADGSMQSTRDVDGAANGGRFSKAAQGKSNSRKCGAKTGKSKGGKGSRCSRRPVAGSVDSDDDGFGNGNDW